MVWGQAPLELSKKLFNELRTTNKRIANYFPPGEELRLS